MAIYECDWGRHRYPQAQQSIYFSHVIGRVQDTYHMRLCPSHFREVAVYLQEHMVELDDDTRASSSCADCGNDVAGVIYAKVFPAKAEPRYFAVDLCAACLSVVGNKLRIFNGRHMGDA